MNWIDCGAAITTVQDVFPTITFSGSAAVNEVNIKQILLFGDDVCEFIITEAGYLETLIEIPIQASTET